MQGYFGQLDCNWALFGWERSNFHIFWI